MIDAPEPDVRTHDLDGVAERLRLAREHAGLSQQEFANRLGYSRRQVIAWGNRHPRAADFVRRTRPVRARHRRPRRRADA